MCSNKPQQSLQQSTESASKTRLQWSAPTSRLEVDTRKMNLGADGVTVGGNKINHGQNKADLQTYTILGPE